MLFRSSYVSLSGADYVITKRGNSGRWYSFAFKLSDFGKRLRKILLGCEYQINFADNGGELDALPLFAYFKAYYDTFGLTLLTNFDTTYARKWQTRAEFDNHVNFGDDLRNGDDLAWRFINDLGNLWVTVSQDYVSAHIASTAVSPSIDMKSRFIDVKMPSNIEQVDSANGNPDLSLAGMNGHSFINGIEHGELDAEYLKRLYRWTNRNTIAGKKIEALLRAQGLGDFCDKCESTFIGYDEVGLTISDVVATSDTFNPETNDGSPLGAYGGRGLAYLHGEKHVYFNREVGYWVSLIAVVPESGYCQAVAKTLEGEVLFENNTTVVELSGVLKEKVEFDCNRADVYLFAEYVENGEEKSVVYSSKLWSGVQFKSDYEVKTEKINAYAVKVTIKANAFAKSVFVSLKDNYKYSYSDNYIDVEAGKESSILITANEPIDEKQISTTDFAKMTM